jgi:trimeric autotransporter adhesin
MGRSPLPLALLVIPLVFACFALSPTAHAVVPAPDGGYPGGNTAEGLDALLSLDVNLGIHNTGIGRQALLSNIDGDDNTAVGFQALRSNTGSSNTAHGAFALLSNTTGFKNTAVGTFALASNIGGPSIFGSLNTAVGDHALADNTSGFEQTAVGNGALDSVTSGLRNTALGHAAGANLTTGQGNLYLGGSQRGVANESNTTYIRNVYDSQATTRAVYVNEDNKIGTLSSSQRYKEEIKPMDEASEALFALKPVTFRYKKEIDRARSLSFGLIAEEVAQTSPDLITCDREGKPETVRYEAINAMLLNEFLKEHRKNEEQQATIAQLKSGMEALTATVKKQAAQIQKVSAQLEVSRPAPRTVLNNQ